MWLQRKAINYWADSGIKENYASIEHKNLSAVVIFIDFKKAFDTIHWGKMMILKAYKAFQTS